MWVIFGCAILSTALFSCDYFARQKEIDSRLEEVGLKEAEAGERAADMSLEQDIKERALKLELDKQIPQKLQPPK